jgi:hypothetical protein
MYYCITTWSMSDADADALEGRPEHIRADGELLRRCQTLAVRPHQQEGRRALATLGDSSFVTGGNHFRQRK